ncbi:MAG: S41 family peptidase [Bradymonadaceae bacterium]|nr:S41 family peptidase [Lujinxingiaceae bacterium]
MQCSKLARRSALALLILLMASMSACADWFIGGDPQDDPETNFEIFWQTFDRHYSHFELKNIDWHGVYAHYRPLVGPQTSDDELFTIFSEMISTLNDGHVYLATSTGRFYSDGYSRGAARNFNREHVRTTYLTEADRVVGEGNIIYGWAAPEIGYIRIASLSGGAGYGQDVRGWITDMDIPLRRFASAQGIIIDLRNNSGGRAFNSQYLAGRFATDRRPFIVTSSRNGPGYGDFSAENHWFVEPTGASQFTGPVVVLTNRFSFSAAEWMTLALRQYPHVTHMGTNSGGGLSMFLPRELPNGWTFTVSVQDTRCIDGYSYEIVGVEPDVHVEIADQDAKRERDTIMDTAIRDIRARAARP